VRPFCAFISPTTNNKDDVTDLLAAVRAFLSTENRSAHFARVLLLLLLLSLLLEQALHRAQV
jgi:hypothetical protein